MRKNISFLFVALIVILSSCDRSGSFEDYESATPWKFHIIAVTDANNTETVEGATVNVYKTEEDQENATNIYLTKQTDAKGEVVFDLSEFTKLSTIEDAKGIYCLTVFKGDLIMKGFTRYLLMNDGETYQWARIVKEN